MVHFVEGTGFMGTRMMPVPYWVQRTLKGTNRTFIGGILGLERGFFVWIYSPLLVEPECQILNGLNDFGASCVKPYGVTFHNVTCCKCTIEPPNVRGKCGKILRPTKNHPQLRNGTHPYISDGCPPTQNHVPYHVTLISFWSDNVSFLIKLIKLWSNLIKHRVTQDFLWSTLSRVCK